MLSVESNITLLPRISKLMICSLSIKSIPNSKVSYFQFILYIRKIQKSTATSEVKS